jgi:hypothetical protein
MKPIKVPTKKIRVAVEEETLNYQQRVLEYETNIDTILPRATP